MANKSQATAAPVSVEVDNTTYFMTPLTGDDIGEFERWMASRTMQIARDACKDFNEADRKIVLEKAVEVANSMTVMSTQGLQLMMTQEGVIRLVWLSLRHRHPDLDISKVRNMLTNPENVQKLMDKMDEVNMLDLVPTEKKKGPPKTKVKRKPRK